MKNTGVTASAMMRVACQIAGRTSSEASRMMRAVDLSLPALRCSRSRRTMFSTSMMASSTTEPSATTKPASTMVLIVAPMKYSASPAATSDSGIAMTLISATRHSYRNAPRTSRTRIEPMMIDTTRLWTDISMKVAGRKMVESMSTPGSPGRRSASTFSTPRVTSSVLAQGSFSTIIIRPGPSLMTASPTMGQVS